MQRHHVTIMMMMLRLVSLICITVILLISPSVCEMVSEQLLIRPLEDGSVLTQTSFILRQSRTLINADRFYHFPESRRTNRWTIQCGKFPSEIDVRTLSLRRMGLSTAIAYTNPPRTNMIRRLMSRSFRWRSDHLVRLSLLPSYPIIRAV